MIRKRTIRIVCVDSAQLIRSIGFVSLAIIVFFCWLDASTAQQSENDGARSQAATPKIKSITLRREGKPSEEIPVNPQGKPTLAPDSPELDVRTVGPAIFDLVQVSDGMPRLGQVTRYSGGMLLFDDVAGESITVPRRDIVAIDLDVNRATPDSALPLQLEPEQDLVILNDGTAVTSKLTVITHDTVGTAKRVLPRDSVDLILIAPEPGNQPAVVLDTPPDPPEPPTTSSTPGTNGRGAGAGPGDGTPPLDATSAQPVKQCPEGRPLGGWVWLKYDFKNRNICRTEVEKLAWFPLVYDFRSGLPGPRDWNASLQRLIAPRVSYEISQSACEDLPDDDQICHAQGVEIHTKLDWTDVGVQVKFDPMKPELDVSFPDRVRPKQRYSCRRTDGTGSGEGLLNSNHGRRFEIGPPFRLDAYNELLVSEYRYWDSKFQAAVEPGACWRAPYPQSSECVSHRYRYAVIPFENRTGGPNKSKFAADREVVPRAQLAWRVCCGCGNKPTGPPVTESDIFTARQEEEDCFKLNKAQHESHEQELMLVREQLADAYATFDQYSQRMNDNHAAYKAAMAICGIRDVVLTTMGSWLYRGFGYINRPPANRLALPPRRGVVMPPVPGSSAITVNDVKRAILALGGFAGITQIAQVVSGEGATDLLKEKLFGCGDVLPRDVYDGALRFIQNRKEVGKAARKMGHYYSKFVQAQIVQHFEMAESFQECNECAEEKGIRYYACWSPEWLGPSPWESARPTHPQWKRELNFWLDVFINGFGLDIPTNVLLSEPVINRYGEWGF